MNEHQQRQLIALIAGEMNRDPHTIEPKHDFIDDLAADSIDTANIVNAVRITFKVTIPINEAEKINTVQDLMDYIDKYKSQ